MLLDAALTTATAGPGSRAASAGTRWRRLGTVALLALILALSAFLQFYRLDDLQHFQGDEGLIALAVRAIFVQHVFPVYGLALAVGSAHIGPLYDYLIALPLWLSRLNPTAGVAVNGAFQVLAVGLCYALMARYGGGCLAGLVAALTFATAQEVVYYSRFMWPNMFPCMVILIVWSLVALRTGRQQHLALLGVWLGAALQLQPTGILLVPLLALYALLFRPPIRSVPYAALGMLAFLLLFAPSIVHDLTHNLVETRAWLAYSHHGNGRTDRALLPTLARVRVLLQRLIGVHQDGLAAALGAALGAGLIARALLPEGSRAPDGDARGERAPLADDGPAPGATLARLLLLLCAVCLAGYLFFGSQLRPHYAMPLFPVPALALGLLAGRWPQIFQTAASPWRGAGNAPALLRRTAAVLVALALAASNVQHTWQAGFLLDRFQITIVPERSNRITLGQMRRVSAWIVRQAGTRNFNLLFIAPDDQPQAYETLLLAAGGHLSGHPARLRFLVVQPPDWRPDRWPAWARTLAFCSATPAPQRFAAALVWKLADPTACAMIHAGLGDNLDHSPG